MAEQTQQQALAEWFAELAGKALVMDEQLATLAGMRAFLVAHFKDMTVKDLTAGQWQSMRNYIQAPTGFVVDPATLPRVVPTEDPWL